MTDKINAGGAQAQPVRAEKRFEIQEGTSVAEVKKYGSTGQKLAASLFDHLEPVDNGKGVYVGDGFYTKYEAERFNDFNFTVRDNSFTMYDKGCGKTTEMKYSNKKDLEKILNDNLSTPDSLNSPEVWVDTPAAGSGKITIDLTNKTVTVDGAKGASIAANAQKVTVKNSDLEDIYVGAKELDIINTKKEGLLYDSAVELHVNKEALVNKQNSKVNIERDR